MAQVSIRIDDDLLAAVDRKAAEEERVRADVIRRALRAYCATHVTISDAPVTVPPEMMETVEPLAHQVAFAAMEKAMAPHAFKPQPAPSQLKCEICGGKRRRHR